jgi:hypothetical protein
MDINTYKVFFLTNFPTYRGKPRGMNGAVKHCDEFGRLYKMQERILKLETKEIPLYEFYKNRFPFNSPFNLKEGDYFQDFPDYNSSFYCTKKDNDEVSRVFFNKLNRLANIFFSNDYERMKSEMDLDKKYFSVDFPVVNIMENPRDSTFQSYIMRATILTKIIYGISLLPIDIRNKVFESVYNDLGLFFLRYRAASSI